MKNVFLFLTTAFIVLSCSKEDSEPASLEITVSYFYNSYQGYKKDVDAKAYLFTESIGKKVYPDSCSVVLARIGLLEDSNGNDVGDSKYEGTADAEGVVKIKDIAPGKYLLLVASKGRWTYSTKWLTLSSGQNANEVKNFYYLHEWERDGESW